MEVKQEEKYQLPAPVMVSITPDEKQEQGKESEGVRKSCFLGLLIPDINILLCRAMWC